MSLPTNSPIVLKIGGALLAHAATIDTFWRRVDALRKDAPVVVVHGGGPQATAMARRLGHEPRIVHGRRVTTDLDLDIIRWAILGELNTKLVAAAVRTGIPAVGLSGADAGTVRVVRRPPWQIDGESVDFGWVGDIDHIETTALRILLSGGFVPVLAPLGIDAAGQVYNVNADTIAQAVAGSLGARAFMLVTDAGGVWRDPHDPTSRLPECDHDTYEHGLAEGWIEGGMRVKLKVAFDALHAGVPEVFICSPEHLGDAAHATRVVF